MELVLPLQAAIREVGHWQHCYLPYQNAEAHHPFRKSGHLFLLSVECEVVANSGGCCTLQEEELAHDAVEHGTAPHVHLLVISHCSVTACLFSLSRVLHFSWFLTSLT